MKPRLLPILLAAVLSLVASSCVPRKEEKTGVAESVQKVVATSATTMDVTVTQQYVCQIHAQRHINVCALEIGYLEQIKVREGQAVKEGDLLFQVLPTLYKARLDVELSEAKLANLEYNNTDRLFKENVVSQNELALQQAKLAKAKAKVSLAESELGFTAVRAPFDGIIDRLRQQQGSLVKEGEVLTTLSDNSTMWVYFNVPEARYLDYMAEVRDNKSSDAVELILANGRRFPQAGKIAAIVAKFDNETGNIPFRADFTNPDRLLRHGQTGNVLLKKNLKGALVVPQRATFENLDKRYVYIVGEDGVVRQKEIMVLHELEDIFVLRPGSLAGERIVLEGVFQVHEGDRVECTFRDPAEVMANLKTARNSSAPESQVTTNVFQDPRQTGTRDRHLDRDFVFGWLGHQDTATIAVSLHRPANRYGFNRLSRASAGVLVDSVLIPLERSINGVQDMRYMSSSATSAGEATIMVYFEPGTDPDMAVVNVQNRISIVRNLLPPLVQREGIIVMQVMPSMLMYVNIFSKEPGVDQTFLYNFAQVNVLQVIRRVHGIGSATILGSREFAMRVWLKPDRLRAYNMSTEDVMKALAEQSIIGSPGRLGQATGRTSQTIEYVLTYKGRFNKPVEYENIALKANSDGQILHLKDVADIELGARFFDIYSDINGYPSAAIVLKQSPGSNAVEVIGEVKRQLEQIKRETFPPGMEFEVTYDVSKFLEASIEKVLHTLVEAFLLVSLVVYLFLGDIRSTLIPTIAVPVSLIGTFFVMKMFGLSINLITLFAMVLAIGVVVDDAIVVVEAVHAKMHEKHLSPFRATREVMDEISGAIVAITLVMTSVFVPVTFVPGPVGTFYRQFGITMAASIVLSGIVALTLTPVLCALILKPHVPGAAKRLGPVGLLLWLFDRIVNLVTAGYGSVLCRIVPRRLLAPLAVVGFAYGILEVNQVLPSGFIPGEDQGMIYGIIQTPPGSTLEYTNAKSHELQAIAMELTDEVGSVSSLAGYEVLTEGRGSNAGTCLINLKPWSERKRTSREIIADLEERCLKISNAKLEFFEPPAVPGFGAAGGFSVRLLDKNSSTDYRRLGEVTDKFMAALSKRPELADLFTFFNANYPQYELVIDSDAAMQKGVSIGKAMDTLGILIGSTYEQGFILFGQFYKLYVQAAPEYRRYPDDLNYLFVKNDKGEMVPYTSFMKVRKQQGLNEITRYNLYPSAAIQGSPAAGYSSGQALQAVKEVAAETLPQGYGLGWEGLSFDQANTGNEVIYIFLIVIAFVFLVLVAQYESFLLPLAVLLSLPIGIFGSFISLQVMGLANDVYAQIGLVMLVGLLGKNGILIVEFAVQRRHEGLSFLDAATEAGKLRFRPIMMTSLAFIAGLLPMVYATGAGAIGNRTIGTGSAGGMLIGTLVGVFVTPGLYYLFAKIAGEGKMISDDTHPAGTATEHPH